MSKKCAVVSGVQDALCLIFLKVGVGDTASNTASNRLAFRVTCYAIANGGVVGYRNRPQHPFTVT